MSLVITAVNVELLTFICQRQSGLHFSMVGMFTSVYLKHTAADGPTRRVNAGHKPSSLRFISVESFPLMLDVIRGAQTLFEVGNEYSSVRRSRLLKPSVSKDIEVV